MKTSANNETEDVEPGNPDSDCTTTETRAERWLKDNRTALDSSNAHVDLHGLPLAQHRTF
jgi:hypothetical protein